MFSRGVEIVIAASVLYAVFLGSAADEEFAATTEPVTPSPGSRRCPAVEGIADTCVCNDGGGKIDLNPLSNTDGTPRFTGFSDSTGFTYVYNPCTPFESKLCDNKEVFSCQISGDGKKGYRVADAGTEEMWIEEDGTVVLFYTGSDKRQTKVSLHCDQEVKNTSITTTGDTIVTLTYLYDITSCHVCPGGCRSETEEAISVAGIIGIVIILLAFGGILTYFIVGAVIMKVRYEATGTDIIPNKNLWFQLPSLVKDGCMFTFCPPIKFIRAKVKGEEYEKM